MRARALTVLVLAVGFMTSCKGGDDDPSNPGAPSPNTPSSPNTPNTPPPSANRPPGVVTIDFQPKTPILAGGTAVSLSATVSDPDGDPLTFTWDLPSEVVTSAGGGMSYTFDRGGEAHIKVTASDGKGGTSTAQTTINVRTLEGEWNLVNPVHQGLVASIRHNGRSFSGRFNSSHSFTGNVNDGNRVFMKVEDGGDFYCLSTGNYSGTIDSSLNVMEFPGVACKGFALHRR